MVGYECTLFRLQSDSYLTQSTDATRKVDESFICCDQTTTLTVRACSAAQQQSPNEHEPHLCESCPLGQQLTTRSAPRRVEIDEPDLIVRLALYELVERVVIQEYDRRVQRVLATHTNN